MSGSDEAPEPGDGGPGSIAPADVAEQRCTRDGLLQGRLLLEQPSRGYRTNVDALWLAAFAARPKRARACLDLGAGVGAVGLALLVTDAVERVHLVDLDPLSCALARRNAEPFGARASVGCLDVRAPLTAALEHAFDLVVCNPPWAARATRPSPDVRRARARTADPETLPGFARAARAALGASSRACFIYPPTELPHLFAQLQRVGLEPKRLRLVHPLPGAPAGAALVEAKPARAGGVRVEPPLLVMSGPGVWSDEAAAILRGTFV